MSVALPPGKEITGPSAFGTDSKRLWRLAYVLASTDFKLKFFGSFLGYVWQLMNPLLLFGVLFLVFSFALDLGKGAEFFPVALLLGIVLFSYLNEATSTAVRSLLQRENLVRKVDFPRLAVPVATVLAASFNLVLNLIPVVVFLLLSGGTPRLSWLLFLAVIVLLVIFSLGLSMLLSVAFVRFRDVEPIWSVALQVMFYASGVFFTFDAIRGEKNGQLIVDILLCNPFATILALARHTLIAPSWPTPAQEFSSPWLVAIPYGLIVLSVVGGYLVFRREAPKVAEEL